MSVNTATTNTRVTLGFIDENGENFNVSVSKVKDLTDAAGETLVNDAMDAMVTNQPYTVELAGKREAYQTVTTKTTIDMH